MNYFICPICREPLERGEHSCHCINNHCFDISRKGFINLLRSQKSSHGDDKLMVTARKNFLDKGYYTPLLEVLQRQLISVSHPQCIILDCGCGECWYTANLYNYLMQNNVDSEFFGIDVSKEAVFSGAGRSKSLKLAVGTVFDIPMSDKSCDIVISLFAPFSRDEYVRVLKDGGCFITAFPMENHLWELKQAVYEKPYKNEVSDMKIDGFELIKSDIVHTEINLCTNEDILSLFSMTPYYYKTSRADKSKLEQLDSLKTQIHFCAATYRKII